MSGIWNDFNSAQSNSNVIPKGTLAKVRLTIRPGGFDDPSQGWTGGYARRGSTGSVYLDVEYTVLEGPLAGITNVSITRHSATRPRPHSLTMRRSSSRNWIKRAIRLSTASS